MHMRVNFFYLRQIHNVEFDTSHCCVVLDSHSPVWMRKTKNKNKKKRNNFNGSTLHRNSFWTVNKTCAFILNQISFIAIIFVYTYPWQYIIHLIYANFQYDFVCYFLSFLNKYIGFLPNYFKYSV